MEIRFDGKRALVTGAGKGIGRGVAKALFDCGAQTYALSRTQADLDSLKKECPSIHTVCVDLADWDASRKAVQDIGAIDLLVNNAAVLALESFLEISREKLEKTLDINVKAVFNVSQVVSKGMVERGKGGAIVNISSACTSIAIEGFAAYTASKGCVDQLTRVMALELGQHQIRVNVVNPAVTDTPMARAAFGGESLEKAEFLKQRAPLGRHSEVSDIVGPVLYLLSDKADMINGAKLAVDGSLTIT